MRGRNQTRQYSLLASLDQAGAIDQATLSRAGALDRTSVAEIVPAGAPQATKGRVSRRPANGASELTNHRAD